MRIKSFSKYCLFLFVSNIVFAFCISSYAAASISFENKETGDYSRVSSDGDGIYAQEKITRKPGLYKFSQSLIKAAETCQSYEEDFYKTNKAAFKKNMLVPINGYLIRIKGKTKKGNCKFETVPQSSFGLLSYKCVITPKQQAQLVAAMKDKSKKTVHKVIEYEQKVGKNAAAKGMNPQKGRLNITGDRFTVLIYELFRKKCSVDFDEE